MIFYILEVAVLTTIAYLFYQYFLSNLTFYKVNRALLLSFLVLAFWIPNWQIPVPNSWFNGVEPTKNMTPSISPKIPPPSVEQDIVNAKPIEGQPHKKKPNTNITPNSNPSQVHSRHENSPSVWTYLELYWYPINYFFQLLNKIYWCGVLFFGIKWLIQLLSLFVKIYQRPKTHKKGYTLVPINQPDVYPCSFWNYIIINPNQYSPDTYQQIIHHEMIHVQQRHTVDVLISGALVVLQWFNPFAWKYAKAIKMNLEFLTDQTMLFRGANRESYQLNLLKVAVPKQEFAQVTYYNFSLLKKRISMMNKKQTGVGALWKYLVIALLIFISALGFQFSYRMVTQKLFPNAHFANTNITVEEMIRIMGDGFKERFEEIMAILEKYNRKDFEDGPIIHLAKSGFTHQLESILYTLNHYQRHDFGPHQIVHLCEIGGDKKLKQILQVLADESDTYFDEKIVERTRHNELEKARLLIRETKHIHFSSNQIVHLIEIGAENGLRDLVKAVQVHNKNTFTSEELLLLSEIGAQRGFKEILETIDKNGSLQFENGQITLIAELGVQQGFAEIMEAINDHPHVSFNSGEIILLAELGVQKGFREIMETIDEFPFVEFSSGEITLMAEQGGQEGFREIMRTLDQYDRTDFSSGEITFLNEIGAGESLGSVLQTLRDYNRSDFQTGEIVVLCERGLGERLKIVMRKLSQNDQKNLPSHKIITKCSRP